MATCSWVRPTSAGSLALEVAKEATGLGAAVACAEIGEVDWIVDVEVVEELVVVVASAGGDGLSA